MRTYEKTHPWITFTVDLRRASARLWMNLGEAASKCEHIAGVPLQPGTASQLQRLYLAKGAAATTAIEGNTLTEEEVLQHLEGKLKLPQSKEYLAQEIDNIVNACNRIAGELLTSQPAALTVERIIRFNREVLEGLELEEGVVPGEIRQYSVGVGGVYRGAPPEDCLHLLERLCEWLASADFRAIEGPATIAAILKAVIAHLYFAWIHPFGDGNGRTARLIEFQILLEAGVPFPAVHLLSNHYNQTRQEYYRQLDYASKSGGDIFPFLEYAVAGFVDGLREQLARIRDEQWEVAWRHYVHELFQDKNGAGEIRQRWLALDLGAHKALVPVGKVTELTPRLAKAYAARSYKTVQRDVAALESMGLVERVAGGVRARREAILAFLPARANNS